MVFLHRRGVATTAEGTQDHNSGRLSEAVEAITLGCESELVRPQGASYRRFFAVHAAMSNV